MKKLLLVACTMGLLAYAVADSFDGTFVAAPTWLHTKTIGAGNVRATFSPLVTWAHTYGTNANQMTTVALLDSSLTNSETRAISMLSDLKDAFGDTVTIGRVRFFAITSDSDNIGRFSIGGAPDGAFTNWVADASDKVLLRPGGLALFLAPDAAGYAIGTNDQLRLVNLSTNAAGFNLYVGGSL